LTGSLCFDWRKLESLKQSLIKSPQRTKKLNKNHGKESLAQKLKSSSGVWEQHNVIDPNQHTHMDPPDILPCDEKEQMFSETRCKYLKNMKPISQELTTRIFS
jgi:hypothetical protein